MVHFTKAKNGVKVTVTPDNGRELFPSKVFTQKPSAWTNVQAVLKLFGGKSVLVQDNTISPAIVYKVTLDGKKETNFVPSKKIPS